MEAQHHGRRPLLPSPGVPRVLPGLRQRSSGPVRRHHDLERGEDRGNQRPGWSALPHERLRGPGDRHRDTPVPALLLRGRTQTRVARGWKALHLQTEPVLQGGFGESDEGRPRSSPGARRELSGPRAWHPLDRVTQGSTASLLGRRPQDPVDLTAQIRVLDVRQDREAARGGHPHGGRAQATRAEDGGQDARGGDPQARPQDAHP